MKKSSNKSSIKKDENEISKKKAQQLATVSRQFILNEIDMELIGAGQTLFASLAQAKKRAENDPYYIAKRIEYKLDLVEKDGKQIRLMPRFAIIHVIKNAPHFWSAWVAQYNIYAASGYNKDHRPSLHRIDPDDHYKFGNIGVLPLAEHLQEHAIPRASFVPVMDANGVVTVNRVGYPSLTAVQEALDVSYNKAKQYSFVDYRAILLAQNKAFRERKKIKVEH